MLIYCVDWLHLLLQYHATFSVLSEVFGESSQEEQPGDFFEFKRVFSDNVGSESSDGIANSTCDPESFWVLKEETIWVFVTKQTNTV